MQPSQKVDVRLERVEKAYGDFVAVRGVSLDIPRGAFFSLLGPSGCGKTTTLRLVAGFERPSVGEVYIRGQAVTNVPSYKRDYSMVFQSFALFPHLTVAGNVAFGLRMRRVARADRDRQVREALALVKLSGLEDRYPKQLSGGQQQRVALARAIVVRPAVLLLDEPLGSLDKKLREEMQVELRDLQRQVGMTTVFVTHDQEEALTMSDRVAVMNQGEIQQIGAPRDVYERPANEFVADFLGVSNLLEGTVGARSPDGTIVDLGVGRILVRDGRHPEGARVRVAVRPEKIRLHASPGDLGIRARIRNVVYRGVSTSVYLEVGGHTLVAYLQNQSTEPIPLAPGAEIACSWDRESAVVFA
jgi:putative spermidine/putrescine transport system ATP-binding protein/spermidine/putrescine transport system ATP-binding protein